ncbi:hypothetical protein [Neisseria shayeganii]|uniref:Lipoprotein n=1 Tax=Neisseria shayeganii 871 TaxID=1032488 RepID=G4CKQ6_9NEIS|nr:hypothetical protein [Neisseria shayeganii]EGY51589.1 hypothetical protein HMPREF9371_2196 [Neisseria shayeganii 871]
MISARTLFAFAVLSAAACAVAQPSLEAPAGAIRAGSMANEILVRDTMTPVMISAHTQGCQSPQGVAPFLKAEPSGAVGQRQWQEIWVVQCGNQNYLVDVTFKETATGVTYIVK